MKPSVIFRIILASFLTGCAPSKPQSPAPSTSEPTSHALHETQARRGRERLRVDRDLDAEWRINARVLSTPPWRKMEERERDLDAIHYRLFFDLSRALSPSGTSSFDAEAQITLRPTREGMARLQLDSSALSIRSVILLNTFESLRFAYSSEDTLEIDLNSAYGPSDTLTLLIAYTWAKEPNSGVYFRARGTRGPIETAYSQSEPEYSKEWFPSISSPSDRATFESVIRVPSEWVALSNGALLHRSERDGYREFHWSQSMPMSSYLFVLTAGRFSIEREEWEGIPVEFYGAPEDMRRTSYSLRNTKDMLGHFSGLLGFRYPFEKYAQAVVPKYMWGGMEHTSATTLNDRVIHGAEEDEQFPSDGLVSHELAHQWFGDLVTCRNWAHLWLNEGFATYFSALYDERRWGRSALLSDLEDGAAWYFAEEDEDPRPVVFPYYRYAIDDHFDSHAYAKGSWVLHMLRGRLGDSAFFSGIRRYLHRHRGGLVETADFRKAMEAASGQDLRSFFEQWLEKPGYPRFHVRWEHDAAKGKLFVRVTQTQRLDLPGGVAGTTPLFSGPIGVEWNGETRLVTLQGREPIETFEFPASQAPHYVRFNATSQWLAKVRTEQSLESWRAQLFESADPTTRIDAAKALSGPSKSERGSASVLARGQSLSRCALEDSDTWVRTRCTELLSTLLSRLASDSDSDSDSGSESEEARVSTFEPDSEFSNVLRFTAAKLTEDKDWRVREAGADLLGRLSPSFSIPLLKKLIHSDPALRVTTSALGSVGRLKSEDSFGILISQLGRESYQGLLLQAVLEGLKPLSDLRTLEIAEEYSASRHEDRIRQGSFSLLITLGRAYPVSAIERARLAIENALNDPSYNIRLSAVQSLGKLGNPRAIPALERVQAQDPEERIRRAASEALQKLRAASAASVIDGGM